MSIRIGCKRRGGGSVSFWICRMCGNDSQQRADNWPASCFNSLLNETWRRTANVKKKKEADKKKTRASFDPGRPPPRRREASASWHAARASSRRRRLSSHLARAQIGGPVVVTVQRRGDDGDADERRTLGVTALRDRSPPMLFSLPKVH